MKNIISLQGLRGYACLLIFISHCYFDFSFIGVDATGYLGVSIFIMLSGYLLVINHYDKPIKPLKELLPYKILKFYPLHFLTLMAASVFSIYGIIKGINYLPKELFKFILNALLLQTWIPKEEFNLGFNSVSWYLSLTFFLIIISPFILKKLKDISKFNLFLIAALAYIIELMILLTFHNKDKEIASWIIYFFPITRSIDFFLGGITALIVKKYEKFSLVNIYNILLILSVCICVLFLILALITPKNYFYYVSAWTFPSMIIVGTAAVNCSHLTKIVFENKIIVFVGNISFEIFLIHQLVIRYMSIFSKRIGFKGTEWYISVLDFIISFVAAIIWRKLCDLKNHKA